MYQIKINNKVAMARSHAGVASKINEILENTINIPEQVKLSLPKLKKINGGEKLSPKLKLPKLKKL